jgi:hypothetical protein
MERRKKKPNGEKKKKKKIKKGERTVKTHEKTSPGKKKGRKITDSFIYVSNGSINLI